MGGKEGVGRNEGGKDGASGGREVMKERGRERREGGMKWRLSSAVV